MSVDKLALIEQSYPEGEYTPEARKVIDEVLEERKQELENYKHLEPLREGFIDARKALGISLATHVFYTIVTAFALKILLKLMGIDLGWLICIFFGVVVAHLIYRKKMKRSIDASEKGKSNETKE
ncbi:MAG: hypothetical protein B6D58_10160 [candidate division Zixibacteria bacterium 4484_95]|nr:MAG: hypothetical protein B6D58_10160 [candidate division Zixibacteria bacterium 4484_95]